MKQEISSLEDDKRNLDLKVAQIKGDMKKLKKNAASFGLDANAVKKKEADLFNINDLNLNQPEAAKSDDDETGIVPPGSHDFNFSEPVDSNALNDDEEWEEEEEEDMIDKVVEHKVEIEEDVVKEVLFDEQYKKSEWYMSSVDVTNYHRYFVQADTNKDGVVDGNEANKFFTKSKLNRKLLAKIWVLADQEKKAKLTEPMFCSMFHLVMKIKKSGNALKVPSELPECLKVDVVQKLGTKIQKTVKQKRWITQKKTIKVKNPNKKKRKKRNKKIMILDQVIFRLMKKRKQKNLKTMTSTLDQVIFPLMQNQIKRNLKSLRMTILDKMDSRSMMIKIRRQRINKTMQNKLKQMMKAMIIGMHSAISWMVNN